MEYKEPFFIHNCIIGCILLIFHRSFFTTFLLFTRIKYKLAAVAFFTEAVVLPFYCHKEILKRSKEAIKTLQYINDFDEMANPFMID
jgi:hypothetical protein